MKYSDEQRAAALARLDANGDNIKRTARETGIPEATIRNWARGTRAVPGGANLEAQKRADLGDELEEEARAVRAVLREKLASATFLQAVTGLGILVDKMCALRAVSGSDSRGEAERKLTPAEREKRAMELAFRGGTNGAGHAPARDAAPVPALVAECLADLELGLDAPPPPDESAGPGDVGAV